MFCHFICHIFPSAKHSVCGSLHITSALSGIPLSVKSITVPVHGISVAISIHAVTSISGVSVLSVVAMVVLLSLATLVPVYLDTPTSYTAVVTAITVPLVSILVVSEGGLAVDGRATPPAPIVSVSPSPKTRQQRRLGHLTSRAEGPALRTQYYPILLLFHSLSRVRT